MPKYYKYECRYCGYILDENDKREPLLKDIEVCPKCRRDKTYFILIRE